MNIVYASAPGELPEQRCRPELTSKTDHGIVNANHPKTAQLDAIGCDPATV
jgi:hypothetical protein